MKRIFLAATVLAVLAAPARAAIKDSLGVIRVFGDQTSWMSACFVVGDGSWAVTALEAVTEKTGSDAEQTIRFPVFISPYTGRAMQCELKAHNKDLAIALLKLPISGLPAAPLAQFADFSKAAFGTLGQLMSGEPIGNNWPVEIYGITREKAGGNYKIALGQWNAKKMFVTDIGDCKWAFASDIAPESSVPNGALAARDTTAIGMYLNKMTLTGGRENVVFGRILMSSEMARWLGNRGVDTATLYNPPRATAKREDGADAAFQLQCRIYSMIGAQRADLAVEPAAELAKMRPEDAQPHMVHGLALTGAGKFEDALKAFDQAVKLDAKLPALRTGRALALVGLKKIDEAEAELLKAVEEAPTDVRPVTAIADFYMADNKTIDKALTYAIKASQMATKSPAAQLLLARAHKRKKNYQAATAAIGEALKMAPEWYDAWYALGATCEEAGDKTSAEKAYRKLVEKQPKNPDGLLVLASYLADQGQKDEALGLIAKVRDLKPPKEVLDAAQALEDKMNGKPEPVVKPG